MALANMQVYNTEIQTSTIELVDQMVRNIAAASRNAIQLTSVRNKGDFAKEAFWQNLSAAQRRVDRNAAIASQSATDLVQLESVGVKVAGGFGLLWFMVGGGCFLLALILTLLFPFSEVRIPVILLVGTGILISHAIGRVARGSSEPGEDREE